MESVEPVSGSGPVQLSITVPPGAGQLTVRIWDRFGAFVRLLVDERNPTPGKRAVTWDRTDDAAQPLGAGSFIWRVTIDRSSESRIVTVR
jgi:hypothetical protein